MKPYHTLLFIINILVLAFLLTVFFPEKGINIYGDLVLEFPTIEELLSVDTVSEKRIENILQTYEPVDSTAILNRLQAIQDSIKRSVLSLQYPIDNDSTLNYFFKSLEKARTKKAIRILHYGDSQIEGDRLTGYLRYRLQQDFGGFGPGLLPGNKVVPSSAVKQINSPNWKRYTLFGKRDSTVQHNRYGILANFARFAPIRNDSTILHDTTNYSGFIILRPSKISYSNLEKYTRLKLFYGYAKHPFQMRLYNGFDLFSSEVIYPEESLKVKTWNFTKTPTDLKIEFEGRDSPEIYALSLESPFGLLVDNIAMRGSSGTIFSKMDANLLGQMYTGLNIKLLILQFGGNAVPYLKNEAACRKYGKWFDSQIKFLKKLLPDISIIVIGVSDMSKKEKDQYISYPLIESIRNALKEAAFKNGAAYWDIYEVMGGKNTMPLWVNADPPLAAKDYVHFTRRGIKKIAELFYQALMRDYRKYQKLKYSN